MHQETPINLFSFLKRITDNTSFQSETIKAWQPIYTRVLNSRWIITLLILLGIARSIFFLQAYAPAHGADSTDYYAYAAYMNGANLPPQVANVSPVFPILVYVSHYILGNFYLVVYLQMCMSASIGLLYYLGLRRYNALFAVLIALMVIGDAQTGVSFNFTSTEPIYIFLLACIYAVTLIQRQKVSTKSLHIGDILLGVLLELLRETRTVARYVVVPTWLLFTLATRQWKRSLIVLFSFILTSMVFNLSTKTLQIEQTASTNDTMLLRPLIEYGLLDTGAGNASIELTQAIEDCRMAAKPYVHVFACLETIYGSEDAAIDVIERAYIESVVNRPFAIYRRMFEEFTAFLRLSGQQVQGLPTPADVQCENIPARVQRQTEYMFTNEWQHIQLTDAQKVEYTTIVETFALALCPPHRTNETIKNITDWIALHYRSLSRPNPYRWYLILLILIIFIPWARRLWFPVFFAWSLLGYHAAISAMLFNVQPRYVMVTNPFKGIPLVATVLIIGYIILKMIDIWLSRDPVDEGKFQFKNVDLEE